ncbi:MAG: hypothetical protein HYS12_00150 [Planctomycetes bacterium]|nr:hypothetical protein [Planctomycetota bacterium]
MSLNPSGLLTIQGTTVNEQVTIASSNGQLSVAVVSGTTNDTATYDDSAVAKIIFSSGGGDDSLDASGTTKPVLLVRDGGGEGTAVGNDLLSVGLSSGRRLDSSMKADSYLSAFLDGNDLTLANAYGYGFTVSAPDGTGQWQRTVDNSGETFTLSGPASIKIGTTDVPFYIPTDKAWEIVTKPDVWDNAGKVDVTHSSFGAGPGDRSSDTQSNNDIYAALSGLVSTTGVHFDLGTPEQTWGIALGKDLGYLGVPLDASVPYLYFHEQTGFSALYGSVTAQSQGNETLSLVLDPSDPAFYVRVTTTSSVDLLAAGASSHGYIPFNPNTTPSHATETIYGHLYSAGGVSLKRLPVEVNGAIVVNLDANQDGVLANITADDLANVVQGRAGLTDLASEGLRDIQVGVNGQLQADFDAGAIDVSFPVAEGTFMYDGIQDQAAFRMNNVTNPGLFTKLFGDSTYAVDGYITNVTSSTPGFSVTGIALTEARFFGIGVQSSDTEFTVSNSGVSLFSKVKDPLGLATTSDLMMAGSVNADGGYSLTFSTKEKFDLGFVTFKSHMKYSMSRSSATSDDFSFTATFSDGTHFDIAGIKVSLDFDLALAFQWNGSRFDISGKAKAKAKIDGLGSIKATAEVDNNGFKIEMGKIAGHNIPDLEFSWPDGQQGNSGDDNSGTAAIAVTKKASVPSVAEGGVGDQSVTYSYEVTNTGTGGNVPLAVDLSDTDGTPTYVSGDTNGNGLLDQGEMWLYTLSAIVPPGDANDFYTSTVTASGTHDQRDEVDDNDSVSIAYTDVLPSINVVKSGPSSANVGSSVTYTYTVTNTSPAGAFDPLFGVSLSDTDGTPTYVSGDTNNDGILQSDETWIYSLTVTMPSSGTTHRNTVTATAYDDENNQATATDSSTLALTFTISGFTFHDTVTNGLYDGTESQLYGWTINLYQESNDTPGLQTGAGGDTLAASQITDPNYSFSGLLPGTYYVREVVPSGSIETTGDLDKTFAVSQDFANNFGDVQTNTDGNNAKSLGYWSNKIGQADLLANENATATPVYEVQTVTVAPGTINGSSKLTFGNKTTGAIAWDAPAAAVQSALNALPSIGGSGGSVTVTRTGPGTTTANYVYTITFGGKLTGDLAQTTATSVFGCTVTTGTISNGTFNYGPTNWRVVLNGLGLRNADGSLYTVPLGSTSFATAYASFANFLLSATATNMCNMLSAQLATTQLNVLIGYVNPNEYVRVDGIQSTSTFGGSFSTLTTYYTYNGAAFVQIQDLISAAIATLNAHPTASSGDAWQPYDQGLKNVFDAINNDLSIFVV